MKLVFSFAGIRIIWSSNVARSLLMSAFALPVFYIFWAVTGSYVDAFIAGIIMAICVRFGSPV